MGKEQEMLGMISSASMVNRPTCSFLKVSVTDSDKRVTQMIWFDPPKPETVEGRVGRISFLPPDQSKPGHNPKLVKFTEDKSLDVDDFIRTTHLNSDEVVSYLKSVTRDHDDLTTIVDEILLENAPVMERFKTWPASNIMHHAFKGGLMEHTYFMVKAAEAMIERDDSWRGVDVGVVMCATTLHDVGKIREYSFDNNCVKTQTKYRYMLGHICIGDEWIVKTCMRNDINTSSSRVLNLRHCVLSHHGRLEFGSPVTPATKEAVLLHQVDMIQSRGQMALEAYEAMALTQEEYSTKMPETKLIREW